MVRVDGTNPAAVPTRRQVLQGGLVLAAGACAPMARVGENPIPPGWTLHPPGAGGITLAGLEGIRSAVQAKIDANVIPGAVSAVVRQGKLVWHEAQGLRDPVAGVPMRRDDIFRIMSSTKPVTSVAVLMMLEEGRLALDDKVSRFIPEFANPKVAIAAPGTTDKAKIRLEPAAREITIRDLLTHTSGLIADRSGGAAYLLNDFEMPPRVDLATYVAQLGRAALDFQPGARWQYSPLAGFDTLMRIVEIASGTRADTFLRERLIEPLGMRDTFFEIPPAKRERVVDQFRYDAGSWQKVPDWLPRPPLVPYISGAAGLYSTVRDFMQFQLMLLNHGTFGGRRYLAAESVELMTTNQVGDKFATWLPPITAGYGFGLGVRIVEDPSKTPAGRPIGAFGWPGAYGTDAFAAPAADVAAAIFIQVDPINFSVATAFGGAVGRAVA